MLAWSAVTVFWLLLNGWIVPRIDQYRPAIEEIATHALGAQVRIDKLSARRSGLLPILEAHHIRVLGADGHPVVNLPHVTATPSLRSALALQPLFTQIVLDAPSMEIHRLADGSIQVAGMNVSGQRPGNSDGLDWLARQPEVLSRDGRILWRDDLEPSTSAAFSSVTLVLRSTGRHHRIRLDATPPASWGERLSLRGDFTHPLLSRHPGDTAHWSGTGYFETPKLSTVALAKVAKLPPPVGQSDGALRTWLTWRNGQWVEATADLALQTLWVGTEGSAPLELKDISGRVALERSADGYRLRTSNLLLKAPAESGTSRAVPPPSSAEPAQLDIRWQPDAHGVPMSGAVRVADVDLALAAIVAQHLALPLETRRQLVSLAPSGMLDKLDVSWEHTVKASGASSSALRYHAQGHASRLVLKAAPLPETPPGGHVMPQRPGIDHADVQFTFSEQGGQAQLAVAQGNITLPGVFEDPEVNLDQAGATVQWQRLANGRMQVRTSDLHLRNDDATVQAALTWTSGDPSHAEDSAGSLDMTGTLRRGKASRAYRYLALGIPEPVRHYVRHAVNGGMIDGADFTVQGPLDHFPFSSPGTGTFHILAQVRDVAFDYAPAQVIGTSPARWPVLASVTGSLEFTGSSMKANVASAHAQRWPQVVVTSGQAQINDFLHAPTLNIRGDLSGPLESGLALVAQSAVGELMQGTLSRASGNGAARLDLGLQIPLEHLDQSHVSGKLRLENNTFRLAPELPALQHVRGNVDFTEASIQSERIEAETLGGTTRASGGWSSSKGFKIAAQGTYSAAGLQEAFLPAVPGTWAEHISGNGNYAANLDSDGSQVIAQWRTNLQGVAMQLPAPFTKPAQADYPVSIEIRMPSNAVPRWRPLNITMTAQRQETLPAVNAHYQILESSAGTAATAAPTPVVRGAIGVNHAAVLPDRGVTAHVALPRLNLDDWLALLPASSLSTGDTASPATAGWLAHRVDLDIDQFVAGGHTLEALHGSVQAIPGGWELAGESRELAGVVQWLTDKKPYGRVVAHLSRLSIDTPHLEPKNAADAGAAGGSSRMPALDLTVSDLRVANHSLGKLTVLASGQEASAPHLWLMQRLDLILPEGTLNAHGSWLMAPAGDQTTVDLTLKTEDTGALLSRLGQPHIIRNGAGTLTGTLRWLGAPYAPELDRVSGQLNIKLGAGQFIKAEPGAASRLLGVLSLQSLPRRLTLDFRDIFSSGLAFDEVSGEFGLGDGALQVHRLGMRGPSATIDVTGSADFIHRTQDLRASVAPEINAGAASLALAAVNPAIGLGSLAAQWVLRRPLMDMARREYDITGSWEDPKVEIRDEPSRP